MNPSSIVFYVALRKQEIKIYVYDRIILKEDLRFVLKAEDREMFTKRMEAQESFEFGASEGNLVKGPDIILGRSGCYSL